MKFLNDVFETCYGMKVELNHSEIKNYFDLDDDKKLSRQEVRLLVQQLRNDEIIKV